MVSVAARDVDARAGLVKIGMKLELRLCVWRMQKKLNSLALKKSRLDLLRFSACPYEEFDTRTSSCLSRIMMCHRVSKQ